MFWKDMAAAATIGGGNKTKFREFRSLWQIGIDAEIQFWKMLKILSKTDEKVKAAICLAQSPKCWLPGCFVKLPAGLNKWARA